MFSNKPPLHPTVDRPCGENSEKKYVQIIAASNEGNFVTPNNTVNK